MRVLPLNKTIFFPDDLVVLSELLYLTSNCRFLRSKQLTPSNVNPSIDKNILPLPDESDFGQLLNVNSNEAPSLGSSRHEVNLGSSINSNGPPINFPSFDGINLSPMRPSNSDSLESSNFDPNLGPVSTRKPHQTGSVQSIYQHQTSLTNKRDPSSSIRSNRKDHSSESDSKFNDLNFVDALSDSYEALSTEPTPSQVKLNSSPISGSIRGQLPMRQNQRNGSYQSKNLTDNSNNNYSAGNSVDLNFDDVHTTRSSMVNQMDQSGSFPMSPGEHQGQDNHNPSNMADHQLVTLSAGPIHQSNNDNNHKVDESDDMMIPPFSRSSSNGNSTQLDPAMITNLLSSTNYHNQRPTTDPMDNDQLYPQLLASSNLSPQPPTNNPRGHAGNLPLSVLLSDLIKLSRPQQTTDGDKQQQGSSVVANRQPSPGILQQLKSFPSPFLALLQNLPALGYSNGAGHSGLSHSLTNNDASESNRHYHKISMSPTDLSAILTRSLRSSSAPLPGFSAPRGYIEPPWIEGEMSPDQYQASQSANADFVANNAAGFVRFQHQVANNGREQQHQAASSKMNQQSDKVLTIPANLEQTQTRNGEKPHYWNQIPNMISAQSPETQRYTSQQAPLLSKSQPNIIQQNSGVLSNNNDNVNVNVNNNNNNQFSGMVQYQRAMNSPSPASQNVQSFQQPQQQVQQYQMQNNFLPGQVLPPAKQNDHVDVSQPFLSQTQNTFNQPMGNQLGPQMELSSSSHHSPASLQHPSIKQQQQQQISVNNAQNRIVMNQVTRKKRSSSMLEDESKLNSLVLTKSEHMPQQDDDSPPLSIVSPDGRPMSPMRLANSRSRLHREHKNSRNKLKENDDSESELIGNFNPGHRLNGRRDNPDGSNRLQAASSGLMTKLLLGTASNTDEIDDDMNDDDESASEKRKEELEDAEFGIFTPEKSEYRKRGNGSGRGRHAAASSKRKASSKKLTERAKTSPGSSNAESYPRKDQQRADIEFYGHPGEETRQLKYGILGSGNYDVYNGGVYSEHDELASAVNSVANYARKPGGSLALKLLGADPLRLNRVASSAFMPAGGRLNGLMRGASVHASSDDPGVLGLPAQDLNANDKSSLIGNSLLDLLYHTSGAGSNSHIMDSGIMSQLGSNTRSVHTDKQDENMPTEPDTEDGKHELEGRRGSEKSRKHPKPGIVENEIESDGQHPDRHSGDIRQYRKGSKSSGTNQFNSYVISPSKMVNIFSDKDLDSAPSEEQDYPLTTTVVDPRNEISSIKAQYQDLVSVSVR